jgi:hypothetical protein
VKWAFVRLDAPSVGRVASPMTFRSRNYSSTHSYPLILIARIRSPHPLIPIQSVHFLAPLFTLPNLLYCVRIQHIAASTDGMRRAGKPHVAYVEVSSRRRGDT